MGERVALGTGAGVMTGEDPPEGVCVTLPDEGPVEGVGVAVTVALPGGTWPEGDGPGHRAIRP